MKIGFSVQDLKKNYDKKTVRKFKDMSEKFKDPSRIKNNPVLYNVYIIEFDVFEAGLTVLNPGTINKEYYMTKGHIHQKSTKEIYIPYSGKGKLMLKKGTKTKIVNLEKGKTYILPKNWGHRLINTGNKPLEVMTIYSKKAGKSFAYNFDKRLFKK